jgi:hypothetical protein
VAEAGRHSISFIVDVDNQVAESNEANNQRTVTVDVAAARTATVKVVVKTFIAHIGSHVGSIKNVMPPYDPVGVANRLKVFAATTDKLFNDNAGDDRKGKGYRLYTERSFTVTCRDSQLTNVAASPLDTDAGKEGLLQAPLLITSNVSTRHNGQTDFHFTWSAKGRPNPITELAFQLVYPRTTRYIWHTISGRIYCVGPDFRVAVTLTDSGFPSDRVFVNNQIVRQSSQGPFSNLWVADPSDPTLVR